ncbi:MAG TPA: nucleotide sugar dehydrogenase [Bryobacteraceae bacterium]|nr:nucleotide sugar dehydrogenase [Bryobacteraceae bacterium]
MQNPNDRARIAVFGLGYVGCVTAACLASLDHKVIGVDPDPHKIDNVRKARAPFYEPGLDEIVQATVGDGRFSATASAAEALADADIALLCVGTPSERNGNLGLDQLRRVVRDVAASLDQRSKPLIVALRSTVFPGTCEDILIPALAGHPEVTAVSNPEFLREGCAVKDFMEPSLVVVGGNEPASVKRVAAIYDRLKVEPCLVSLRTAEMIKYACNAFHAVKIAFANEIGALASKLDVNGLEVMDTLCQDKKLNVSAAYLKPGFAFGGSCLPKDLRALTYRAARLDLKLPLLESAMPSNDRHLDRATQAVLDLKGRIGMVGLAFKENTDDLRESPVVTLLEYLIGKGREIKIFDPHIQLDQIYGSNRDYILNAIPHIGKLLTSGFEEVSAWADHLVVTQKPSRELAAEIEKSGKPVLDLARGLG